MGGRARDRREGGSERVWMSHVISSGAGLCIPSSIDYGIDSYICSFIFCAILFSFFLFRYTYSWLCIYFPRNFIVIHILWHTFHTVNTRWFRKGLFNVRKEHIKSRIAIENRNKNAVRNEHWDLFHTSTYSFYPIKHAINLNETLSNWKTDQTFLHFCRPKSANHICSMSK